MDIKKRSLGQMNGSRIYDPYPLDFVYAYANKNDKEEEIDAYEGGIYRTKYDEYSYIHKNVFHRKNLEEDIFNNLTNVKENVIFKNKIGRIRDIQVHPLNGKIYFLAGSYLWLMEKN